MFPQCPSRWTIEGSWEVRFAPDWGAPPKVVFDKSMSWSEHADPGVRYFSGTATYRIDFNVPAEMVAKGRQLWLDFGKVEVMAEVALNGKNLGVLWKSPYRTEVTSAVQAGENALEVKVANLWINRMIGDEELPEDSDRLWRIRSTITERSRRGQNGWRRGNPAQPAD